MLLHGGRKAILYGIIMRMRRRFYKKWKKEEDDGLDGNFPIRFLNAGLHAADRKDCLSFLFRQQGGSGVHAGLKMEKRRGLQGTGSFPGEGYKKAARYNQNIENGRGR